MISRPLFDGEHLRATVLGDHADRLIVTFDHWSATKDGFPPPRNRSSYVDKGFTHLHLATRRNDWFLNPDLPGALDEIATFAAGFSHRVTLAFSMGGFGALMVSRVVDFAQALLVSPHSTFSPAYPPHDDRFAAAMVSEDFAAMAYRILLDARKSRADCVVLYDSTARFDAEHATAAAGLFRKARLVDLEGGGHPATQRITNNNRFGMVMRAITGEQVDIAPLVALHKELENAPR